MPCPHRESGPRQLRSAASSNAEGRNTLRGMLVMDASHHEHHGASPGNDRGTDRGTVCTRVLMRVGRGLVLLAQFSCADPPFFGLLSAPTTQLARGIGLLQGPLDERRLCR